MKSKPQFRWIRSNGLRKRILTKEQWRDARFAGLTKNVQGIEYLQVDTPAGYRWIPIYVEGLKFP